MATNTRDPRSIITPEAFGIDRSLLGTPLARPGQRLIALLIDLVMIGLLTAFSSGFTVFIWAVVGAFLVWVAFKKPNQQLGQITSMLYRGSIGCLGVLVLLVVLIVGLTTRFADEAVNFVGDSTRPQVTGQLRDGFIAGIEGIGEGLGASQGLRRAATEAEAEEAAMDVLDAFDGLSASFEFDASTAEDRSEILTDLLLEAMGEDPAFTEDPRAFAERMAGAWEAQRSEAGPAESAGGVQGDGVSPASDSTARADVRARVEGLPLEDAVREYRALLAEGGDPTDSVALAALRERVVSELAADTVETLTNALRDQEERRVSVEGRLADVRAELEENSSFVALLRDIWDQAGSAVGLWSLYFTVTLTLFRGYTVGKRIMGIRVLRLDGQPITWWAAFERAGGYVAGIATGLLGFLQIFWDPNRQCVHDKIGRTVVVLAGKGPIEGAVEAVWSQVDPDAPRGEPSRATGGTSRPGSDAPGPASSR